MVLNLILAALTFMASGYSLSLMCLLRRLRRDPRPAAAAVFVLLAFGIMQFTWLCLNQVKTYHPITPLVGFSSISSS